MTYLIFHSAKSATLIIAPMPHGRRFKFSSACVVSLLTVLCVIAMLHDSINLRRVPKVKKLRARTVFAPPILTGISNKLTPIYNVTLMGQFNYPSQNYSEWVSKWSQVIKDIVIATPDQHAAFDNVSNENSNSSIRFMVYHGDQGTKSPYSNLARVIRENSETKGFLYVHDDMLLTRSTLEKVGTSEWIMSAGNVRGVPPDVRLYKNGSIVTENVNLKMNYWKYWPGCRRKLLQMFDDDFFRTFLKTSEDPNNPFINLKTGQSDMLYVYLPSVDQRDALLGILDFFNHHKLFLECAIPAAVTMMEDRFSIQVYTAKLCTDWTHRGGNVGNLIKRCFGRKNSPANNIVHPVKIGRLANWKQFFDYLLTF